MTVIETLKPMLKRHEGLRLKAYKDTRGILTIGYGRNIEEVGISEEEAEILLENDIQSVENEAYQFSWYPHLSEPRKVVVLNMLFNLGMPTFRMFERMIAALEDQDYESAAKEMTDSRWARQVGSRANQLAEIMETGVIR